jgi:hypothetical protein
MLTSFDPQGPAEIFPGYVLVPTGGLVHYVHASGAAALDLLPNGMRSPVPGGFYASVASALAGCRANRGDRIVCLPGHTESLATAASWTWVAGVSVIGTGTGDNRAAFTWTAAGSTNVMSAANCAIRNCNLFLAGADAAGSALTVAAPLTMSGAGCEVTDCEIKFGFDADQIVTQGVTVTGDRCKWLRNNAFGATAAECTAFMDLNAAHDFHMEDSTFLGATSNVAVGLVRFVTAASLNVRLIRNTYINKKASSTCAVTGLANVSGVSRDEHFAYLDTSSLTPWLTSTGIMTFHRPTVTNTAGETGTEVVGTVSA